MGADIDLDALERDTRSTRYPGKPFGYEYSMDMQAIEDQMQAAGWDRKDVRFTFEAGKRYQASKANDLTFKQRQDLAKWLGLAWAGGAGSSRPASFTADELAYIADRLAGANDPIGQAVLGKIVATRRLLDTPVE
jgi:hypothetical protein